jgi:hypothetical protein
MSTYATERPDGTARAPAATGWIGFVVFGGLMLILSGGFQMLEGLSALLRDAALPAVTERLAIELSYTTWAWVHLVVGLITAAAGAGVLAGLLWARIAAVVFVAVAALTHLVYLPAAPVWCTLLIAMDVLVIYALCAHGRDVRQH